MSNNVEAHASPGAALMGVPQLLHATESICTRPHYTPLGLAGGNVWKSCSNILNAFVTFGT
ncbi:hypothetical protein [Pseudomonas mandelii]|uniref:Uncharacterized protein n=1 Tax=Pseudomonas mandelii TaxID=75612 RepID=A0A502IAC7_9PSED|nr:MULTISPECIES: hypothetical protein [Pseudomonas]TPG83851.1 hypothetical protein EAH74_13230 [Pseudomonas mandelii]TPG92722.1 hypothetical protein EAH72_22225 [Pseudomonas caspiana]